MNVWDFREIAILARKGGEYANSDVLLDGTGLPNNVTVIEPTRDVRGPWTVYFTEKGQIFDQHFFASEDEACRFVLERDIYSTPPPMRKDTETPEERGIRRRKAQERDDEYRADLRARGLLD